MNREGIQTGLHGDDLEKQLQEEENKLSEGASPESVLEKSIETEVSTLERNIESVNTKINDIGGQEEIQEVLNKMSPEEVKAMEKKIKERSSATKSTLIFTGVAVSLATMFHKGLNDMNIGVDDLVRKIQEGSAEFGDYFAQFPSVLTGVMAITGSAIAIANLVKSNQEKRKLKLQNSIS